VSVDSPEANKAFQKKFQFPYALLSDPDQHTAKAYGADQGPKPGLDQRVTFVIGPDQTIKSVLAVNNADDAGAHADQVLAVL